jgi:chemotaxis protein methyltransferase CheR
VIPSTAVVERLRAVLSRRLGLAFEDGKLDALTEALERRAERTKVAMPEYVGRLENASVADELHALAQELTITETYFFRHHEQLDAFCEAVLSSQPRRLRILSAGCASGEEPYSLAILAREALGPSADVSIVGIDVNAGVLRKAARARYTKWSLRETPADVLGRWFLPEGAEYAVHPDIRRMVTFEQRNLVDQDPAFWRREAFDVVLCRNVLMYFTPDATQAVTRRIAESLVPGGCFFLGYAETWRALARDFELCEGRAAFYYRRRDVLPSVASAAFSPSNPVAAALAERDAWFDVIRGAANRVTSLTESFERPAAVLVTPEERRPSWDAAQAARLVHEERISEVETMLAVETSDAGGPQKLLLRAFLLVHDGNVAGAEKTCEALVELDETRAGARYILALCRENRGDRGGAMEQDLLALQADSSFAMPRFHLGLLARRAGDPGTARRHFAQALMSFEQEDAARLLLFGGGFARDALIELCRAELGACERFS